MKPSEQSSRRRICILTPSLAGRGAERKALYAATGLIERGHEVDLLLQRLICHYLDEVPDGVRIFFQSRRIDGKTRKNLEKKAVSVAAVPDPGSMDCLRFGSKIPGGLGSDTSWQASNEKMRQIPGVSREE